MKPTNQHTTHNTPTKTNPTLPLLPLLLTLLHLTQPPTHAQRPPRNPDPTQIIQRLINQLQQPLQLNNDEWQIIKPRITQILQQQRNNRPPNNLFNLLRPNRADRSKPNNPNRPNRPDRPNRAERPNPDQPNQPNPNNNNPTAAKLQAAIQTGDTTQIQTQTTAYRHQQKQNAANLKKARDNLRQLLTPKQEAQLLLLGILD